MARYIDTLWREGVRLNPTPKVFLVQNVIDYYFSHPQDRWGEDDLPNLAPPFMNVWTEGKIPSAQRVARKIIAMPWQLAGQSYGFKLTWEEINGAMASSIKKHADGTLYDETRIAAVGGHEKLRWRMRFVLYINRWSASEASGDCIIAADGKVATMYCAPTPADVSPHEQEYVDVMKTLLFSQLMAVCFMHCKNVAITEHTPDIALQKATVKRHGIELVTYHTLDIDPMKKILTTEGRSEEEGLQRALHICRGHFATYTAERPLFGRSAGTFWIPDHARGSIESGVRLKDYNVKAGVVS